MQPIVDVLDIQSVGDDQFLGAAVPSNITRTFGGQVASQALRAAQATVEGKLVHSLHSYFLAPSDSTVPLSLRVERLRDGRSFTQREVRAYQGEVLKFVMVASFHGAGDRGPEHQVAMPDVPAASELVPGRTQPGTGRVLLGDWDEWDIRMVPEDGRDFAQPAPTGPGFRNIWFRNTVPLPDDAALHQAALTYMSDMTLLRSAIIEHPDMQVQMASLDHALWFSRPVNVNQWMLYSQDSPSAQDGRGLTRGFIFSAAGDLLVEVAQEGLLRQLR